MLILFTLKSNKGRLANELPESNMARRKGGLEDSLLRGCRWEKITGGINDEKFFENNGNRPFGSLNGHAFICR